MLSIVIYLNSYRSIFAMLAKFYSLTLPQPQDLAKDTFTGRYPKCELALT